MAQAAEVQGMALNTPVRGYGWGHARSIARLLQKCNKHGLGVKVPELTLDP